jgi:hypothetical protein
MRLALLTTHGGAANDNTLSKACAGLLVTTSRCCDSSPYAKARIMRYELTDREWTAIKSMLPNKPRGIPRVNDRRVLNGGAERQRRPALCDSARATDNTGGDSRMERAVRALTTTRLRTSKPKAPASPGSTNEASAKIKEMRQRALQPLRLNHPRVLRAANFRLQPFKGNASKAAAHRRRARSGSPVGLPN